VAAYATALELQQIGMPPDVDFQSDGTRETAALDVASRTADGYLSVRYTLPLTAWGKDLTRVVAMLAAWDLAVATGMAAENGERSNLYLRQRDAIKWLEGVAAGKIEPSGVVDSSGGSGSQGTIFGTPEIVTGEKRGW
jgi:phage gp36-like protein